MTDSPRQPWPQYKPPPPETTWGSWIVPTVVVMAIIVFISAMTALYLNAGPDGEATAAPAPTHSDSTLRPSPSPSRPQQQPTSDKPLPPAPSASAYAGTGDDVVAIQKPADGPVILEAHYTGTGAFRVLSNNQSQELLTSPAGPYEGTVLMDEDGSTTSKLDVYAEGGRWSIRLRSLDSATRFTRLLEGDGDAVVSYTGPAGTADITNRGPGPFVVRLASAGGVINAEGDYDGHSPIDSPSILAITSSGHWKLDVNAD